MPRPSASVPPDAIRIEDEVWQEAFSRREPPRSRRLQAIDGGRLASTHTSTPAAPRRTQTSTPVPLRRSDRPVATPVRAPVAAPPPAPASQVVTDPGEELLIPSSPPAWQ